MNSNGESNSGNCERDQFHAYLDLSQYVLNKLFMLSFSNSGIANGY